MDSVGAQPSQPSGNQSGSSNNRGKITNILHPLRKSNQSKDLGHLSQEQYVAAGRIASPGPPQLELSGSPRSPLLSYSPPPIYHQQSGGSGMGKTSYFSPHSISSMSGQNPLIAHQQQQPPMQSGSRRSKEYSLGKAWDPSSLSRRRSRSEDNENIQQQQQLPDSNYIPYHGPISPPAENPSFARPTGLVGYSQPISQPQSSITRTGGSEGTSSSSLIGLGLSDASQNMSRYSPSYMTMSQRSQQVGGPSIQTGKTTSPSSTTQRGGSTARKGGAIMGTGLPSSYTHGGNTPADAYAPRSGALRDTLPSSMRFDKEQSPSIITSSGTWPFRRDPFYPGQSQAGPSAQQRTTVFPPSSAQSREMKPQTSSSTMNSTRRTGVGANSASSSPLIANISIHRQDSSIGSSSEGHSGSFATTQYPAFAKGHNSASTSLTSLRDGSVSFKASGSGARGTSIDQKSLPRTSMQQQRIQHRKADSRSTINSLGTRPSSSDREAETATKDVKGKSTNTSRGVGGPDSVRSVQSVQSSDGFGSSSDTSPFPERVNLQPGELVPPRFVQVLSPIAASSSGETGQLSQSERFEPASATISQTWSEALSPSAQARTPFTSSSPSRIAEEQPQNIQPAITQESNTATGADNLRRDAAAESHRRFTLLQQLHLDELTSHAPEAGGWLEPKNGCERVLMPRPTLRGGMNGLDRYDDDTADGYHSEGGQALRRSTRAAQRSAAFERNRRMPAAYPRNDDHDASRTQALLAQDQVDTFGSANGRGRPFFHHRMPPDVPANEDGEHAGPSGKTSWVMTDERPDIPVRTSSRRGHRRRAQSSADARDPSTPALTPNIMSDSDDEDIPDSSMVLAQGRALEQEREKWREQHRKSFAANDPSYRRSQSQHRKSNRSSGKKPVRKEQAGLRQAKSTPDLREKSKSKEDLPPPMPNSPPPTTSCFPRSKKHESDQEQRLGSTRSRSKSMEGLSRLRASAVAAAASLAAPCGGQLSSSQRRESEKDVERRKSKTSSRRARALTLSRYDLEKRASLPSDDRVMHDRPFVIGRQMEDKNTSPGLGKGPLQIRHPSWYKAGTSVNPPIDELRMPPSQATQSTVDQFGAAISSPRPNLGLRNTQNKSQEDLSTPGRHATKKGYHRPSSSDQLAAYLNLAATNRSSVQATQGQTASSSASSSKERDSYLEQRSASQKGESGDEGEKRRLSLGMSRVLGMAIDPDQSSSLRPTPDSEIMMRSRPQGSLPVPPRRQRTSSIAGRSSLSPSTSPPMEQEGQTLKVDPDATPKMASAEASSSGKVGIPHSPFTSLQSTFTAQSGAFQTPPLVQPVHDDDWFGSQGSHSRSQDRSVDRILANTMATSSPPLRSAQREAMQQSTLLRGAHVPASLLDEQDLEASGLQRSHSVTGRISSDDTASQHSREMLWNTDEHGDEAFNSLFFRRPSQNLSRDLSGLASIYSLPSNTSTTHLPDRRLSNVNLPNQSSSTNPTAEKLFDEESPNQEEMERGQREYQGEEVGDVTQTSIAHDSSAHAADTTIERMMGNLLRFQSQSLASMDRSTRLGRDSALDDNESAWNESSIGDHYAPPQGSINIGGIRAAETPAQNPGTSAPVSRIDQILSMRLGRVHGGKQPQIQGTQYDDSSSSRPNTRLRDRADTGLSDVNDEGEEEGDDSAIMDDDRNSTQITHEIIPRETPRPRVESFAASVLMYPTSEQGTQPNSPEQTVKRQLEVEEDEEARTGFIDFASPAAPRPLSLADEIASGSALQRNIGPSPSGSHLAPPSAWQTRSRHSLASSGSDSGSDYHVQRQRQDANAPSQSRRESDGIMNMVRSRVWPTPPHPTTEFSNETPSADDSADQRD